MIYKLPFVCEYVKIHHNERDFNMKNLFAGVAFASVLLCGVNAIAVTSGTALRGNQGLANAYKQNQRNTYYMVQQPDVDTACREKIFNCLRRSAFGTLSICDRI